MRLASAVCVAVLGCGPAPAGEYETRTEDVTVCAGSSTVEGIDVSYYQGTINWSQVAAAGKKFAVIRVSDGTTTPDTQFARNWSDARSAGVIRGVYQFFRASQDATAQADLLVNALNNNGGLQMGDLPPVADVEVSDGQSASTVASKLNTWMARVQAGTGRTPLIYTSPGVWGNIGNPQGFSEYVLWVAHYGVSCPSMPSGWTAWKFWQYSDSGSVSGISGAVDLDHFNGSLSELMAFANGGSTMPDAGTSPDAGGGGSGGSGGSGAGGSGGSGAGGSGGSGTGGSGGPADNPGTGTMISGCSVGGHAPAGAFWLILLLVVAARRRSRAR
jgi:lysozyme